MRLITWLEPSSLKLSQGMTVAARYSGVEHGPAHYARKIIDRIGEYETDTLILQNVGSRHHPEHGDVVDEPNWWGKWFSEFLNGFDTLAKLPRAIYFDIEGHYGPDRQQREEVVWSVFYRQIWQRMGKGIQVGNFDGYHVSSATASPHLYWNYWRNSHKVDPDRTSIPDHLTLVPWVATQGPYSMGTFHRAPTWADCLDDCILALRAGAREIILWTDPANVTDEEVYWGNMRALARRLREART